eukprot:sb/3475702/
MRSQEPTDTSKQPIRNRYLGHVTCYQPIKDQYFLIRSVPVRSVISQSGTGTSLLKQTQSTAHQDSTETSKQPIRTLYLGHVTGYQPIRDEYFLIRSVLTTHLSKLGVLARHLHLHCNRSNQTFL